MSCRSARPASPDGEPVAVEAARGPAASSRRQADRRAPTLTPSRTARRVPGAKPGPDTDRLSSTPAPPGRWTRPGSGAPPRRRCRSRGCRPRRGCRRPVLIGRPAVRPLDVAVGDEGVELLRGAEAHLGDGHQHRAGEVLVELGDGDVGRRHAGPLPQLLGHLAVVGGGEAGLVEGGDAVAGLEALGRGDDRDRRLGAGRGPAPAW